MTPIRESHTTGKKRVRCALSNPYLVPLLLVPRQLDGPFSAYLVLVTGVPSRRTTESPYLHIPGIFTVHVLKSAVWWRVSIREINHHVASEVKSYRTNDHGMHIRVIVYSREPLHCTRFTFAASPYPVFASIPRRRDMHYKFKILPRCSCIAFARGGFR